MIYRVRTSGGELKAVLSAKVATDIFSQIPGQWQEQSPQKVGKQMFIISCRDMIPVSVSVDPNEIILVLWNGDAIYLDEE